jgi:hypothetical protein
MPRDADCFESWLHAIGARLSRRTFIGVAMNRWLLARARGDHTERARQATPVSATPVVPGRKELRRSGLSNDPAFFKRLGCTVPVSA